MIRGKGIELRTVRETDLDRLYTLLSDIANRGDFVPLQLPLEHHERYGDRIIPGGDMYEKSQEFLDWAASYDTGGLDMRSRQRHEQWLSSLPCPIVCMEGEYAIEEQLAVMMAAIQR